MIKREIEPELVKLANSYKIVTITGPRQSGKTTLAKRCFPKKPYVSLEDPDERMLANSDPASFLNRFPDGAIIDEIQRVPPLLSWIQGIVDNSTKKNLFILTGSNQFELMSNITQSLVGRTALLKLLPFTLSEITAYKKKLSTDECMFFGFYPGIHEDSLDPVKAYGFYFETYLERDLRQIANIKDLTSFHLFIKLLAGRVGSLLNMNSLASETGVSVPTIKSWLSILESSYIIFFLQPWHTNLGKRLIKTPKLYFYDTGLVVRLLDIENLSQLSRDPLRGSLFENMVIIDLLKTRFNNGLSNNFYFYRDRTGNEVDLLIKSGHTLTPVEIKSSKTYNVEFAKTLTHLRQSNSDLFGKGFVIYDGDKSLTVNDTQILPFRQSKSILSDSQ